MEPTGPAPPRAPASVSGVDSGAPRWQLGQVLQATALADTRNGQTPLQIGRQLVQAQTPVPLQGGQQLSLQGGGGDRPGHTLQRRGQGLSRFRPLPGL